MRRVVVTGLGVVSPIGIGVDAFWNHLTHSVSGVGRITKFDPAGLPSQIAAEIAGFDPEAYLPRRDVVRTDTFIHFALTASQQALADAKMEPSAGDARMGVSIGTSLGGLPLVFKTYDGLLQEQMRGVNPYAMPGFLPNMAAGWVSMRTGARGPIACPTTACAAGGHARPMRLVLAAAGVAPRRGGYKHGPRTSVQPNRPNGTHGDQEVFGSHAYRLSVSSTKSMTGHLLGAAGAVEAIATVLALEHGVMPPTINYRSPDAECDLDYVPNQARHRNVGVALSNSFGFGGVNATLVFKRPDA